MKKKAYLKPETEVLVIGMSSILNNSTTSTVQEVRTQGLGDSSLGLGGASSSTKPGSLNARGNERNADGLSDWNVKLW